MNLDYYYSKNCSEELFKAVPGLREGHGGQRTSVSMTCLVLCYELFHLRCKDILAAWQNKYQYILIDEFQDINRVQCKDSPDASSARNNLFIVGDDDQSIYRFRGAKPEIILALRKTIPGQNRRFWG